MKLDEKKHRVLDEKECMAIVDYDGNAQIEFFRTNDLLSAIEGLKASIKDSFAQELPIDEEYIINSIDYWIGNAFYEWRCKQEMFDRYREESKLKV